MASRMGFYAEAVRYAELALDLNSYTDDFSNQDQVALNDIAEARHDLANYEEALTYCHLALETALAKF